MDGQYNVISELNKGSEFSFGMPKFKNQKMKQEERKVKDFERDESV